jgi:hypothetical protein
LHNESPIATERMERSTAFVVELDAAIVDEARQSCQRDKA